MKVTKAIKVEKKNLVDIFNLECVYAITKNDNGKPVINIHSDCTDGRVFAQYGEYICQFENGRWQVFGSISFDNIIMSGRD